MKKFLPVLLTLIALAPLAHAQGFVPLAGIPGLTDQATIGSPSDASIVTFLNHLYTYLIGLGAALAVIEIIWGGLLIAVKGESISKNSEGRKKITQALIGLLLLLAPVLVFTAINPSILNLTIGMPALNTANGTISQPPTLPNAPTYQAAQNPGGTTSTTAGSQTITLPTPGDQASIQAYQQAITTAQTQCANIQGQFATHSNGNGTITATCTPTAR